MFDLALIRPTQNVYTGFGCPRHPRAGHLQYLAPPCTATFSTTTRLQDSLPVYLYAAQALFMTDESCTEKDRRMREELERVRLRMTVSEVYGILPDECTLGKS